MLFKINLFKFILLLFLYTSVEVTAHQNSLFNLLRVSCSGELRISSEQRTVKIAEKFHIGNVQGGMLFNNIFFAIDSDKFGNFKLIGTELNSKNIIHTINLKASLDKNYRPWQIGYVDSSKIIFSAYRYDKGVQLDKQLRHAYIYEINRFTKTISKINIQNCKNDKFSYFKNRIYYTATDGRIYEYFNKNIKSLGMKGTSPTVSPDGKKIAYISFGLLMNGVYIYDLQTNKKTSVIKFFGPDSIWPLIRWSNNHLLAVKKRCDLFSNTLYIIDLSTKKIIYKLKKSYACNWFFFQSN